MAFIVQGFAESLQQRFEDPRPKTLPYLEEVVARTIQQHSSIILVWSILVAKILQSPVHFTLAVDHSAMDIGIGLHCKNINFVCVAYHKCPNQNPLFGHFWPGVFLQCSVL